MEIEGEGRLRKVDVFNLCLFPSKHSNFTLHGYNLRDCVHQTLFHHTKTNPQKKEKIIVVFFINLAEIIIATYYVIIIAFLS